MQKPDNKPNNPAQPPKPARDENGRFAPNNGKDKKGPNNRPNGKPKKKHCTCAGDKTVSSEPERAVEFIQSILDKRPDKVTIDNLVFYSEPCMNRITKYYRNKCSLMEAEHAEECDECSQAIDECIAGYETIVDYAASIHRKELFWRITGIFSFIVATLSLLAVGAMLFFGNSANPPSASVEQQGEVVAEVAR